MEGMQSARLRAGAGMGFGMKLLVWVWIDVVSAIVGAIVAAVNNAFVTPKGSCFERATQCAGQR